MKRKQSTSMFIAAALCALALSAAPAAAQCINGSSFGTVTFGACDQDFITATTCAFAGEYSTFNSLVTGYEYEFMSTGGAGNYITITDTSNNALAWGFSPLIWTSTLSGGIRVHVSVNAQCVTDLSCHSVQGRCLGASSPNIDVDPLSLSSTQPVDTITQQTLTISNTGGGDLEWEVLEAQEGQGAPATFQTLPDIAAAPEPVFDVPAEVTSVNDCAAFDDFPGREPRGWGQFCAPLNGIDSFALETPVTPLGVTSTGYAQDIGYISDHFVSFVLNDFPGQTVVENNILTYYGIDFDATATTLYALNDTNGELGMINADGSFTPIVACPAPDGATNWTGLAIDPVTNVLYASTAANLYRLDPAACSPVLVGPFGGGSSIMIAIAIGPQGVMYGHDIETDSIYTIDTTTGAATLVGATGYSANFAQGMDFDNEDGTLYIWLYVGAGANIYGTVNLATGAVTPLATDNPQGEFEGTTQTSSVCTNPIDVPWLSVDPDNGTTAPGDNATVDVTFDSTGLAVGTYNATLCIASNDPDNGTGNGTELVVVPVTMDVVECLVDGDCDDDGLYCTGDPMCDNGTCGFTGDPCGEGLPFCDEENDTCVECLTDADCPGTEVCRGNMCLPPCELIVNHNRIRSDRLTRPRRVILNVTSADELFDIFGQIDPGVFTWQRVMFNQNRNRIRIRAIVPAGLAPGAYPIGVGDCFGEVVVE